MKPSTEAESVIDAISEDFYAAHQDWIEDNKGLFVDWINRCWSKGLAPDQASKLIQRAYIIYLISSY